MNDRARPCDRADLVAVIVALVLPSLIVIVHYVVLAGYPAEVLRPVYALGKVVQFGFPVVWVVLIRRRRLSWKKPRRGPLEALLFGLAVAGGMLVLYFCWFRPAGYLAFAQEPLAERLARYGLTGAASYGVFGAVVALVHSFLEEYYWRWFAFGGLRRILPVGFSLVISSLAFMAHHAIIMTGFFGGLSTATVGFSLAVAVGGGVWAWTYHRSGSLVGPWLSHLLIDAAMFLIGYDLVRGHLGG